MLFRFSLYGVLKNQRYYDPFLILAFREKGLSFLQIGILIGFREAVSNLFEVPSGAVADLYGRCRSMIFSFSAYIEYRNISLRRRSTPILFSHCSRGILLRQPQRNGILTPTVPRRSV